MEYCPVCGAPQIVYCEYCKHKPFYDGYEIVGPKTGDGPYDYDETCPCLCVDSYYSYIPDDDFFCAKGER